MQYYERFVGLRYLRAKPFQTLMSTVGVVLGIVVVIVSLSVFSGFQETLRDKLLGAEAHLVVWQQGGHFRDSEAFLRDVEKMPKVAAAAPAIVNQALLRNYRDAQAVSGAQVKGLDPERAPRVGDIEAYLASGSLDFDRSGVLAVGKAKVNEGDTIHGGIILGWALARRLRLEVGDPVVVFAEFREVRGAIYPRARTFIVVDKYTSGLYEIDANVAFISLAAAQNLYGMGDDVTQVEIRAKDPDAAADVQQAILERFGLEFIPKTWKELRGSFFNAMELEKRLTFVILGLIIVVAAFSIAITLIMLVMEKIREIGALKAMGAADGSILRIFMLNGTLIGVAGALIGTVLSLLLCWVLKEYLRIPLPGEVYQVDHVPVRVSWGYVTLVNVLSIAICWVATLYPALRASRLNPVEALRYE
jgi:lipoprotein-releasing system permease protein